MTITHNHILIQLHHHPTTALSLPLLPVFYQHTPADLIIYSLQHPPKNMPPKPTQIFRQNHHFPSINSATSVHIFTPYLNTPLLHDLTDRLAQRQIVYEQHRDYSHFQNIVNSARSKTLMLINTEEGSESNPTTIFPKDFVFPFSSQIVKINTFPNKMPSGGLKNFSTIREIIQFVDKQQIKSTDKIRLAGVNMIKGSKDKDKISTAKSLGRVITNSNYQTLLFLEEGEDYENKLGEYRQLTDILKEMPRCAPFKHLKLLQGQPQPQNNKKYLVLCPASDKGLKIAYHLGKIKKPFFQVMLLGDLKPSTQLTEQPIILASNNFDTHINFLMENGFDSYSLKKVLVNVKSQRQIGYYGGQNDVGPAYMPNIQYEIGPALTIDNTYQNGVGPAFSTNKGGVGPALSQGYTYEGNQVGPALTTNKSLKGSQVGSASTLSRAQQRVPANEIFSFPAVTVTKEPALASSRVSKDSDATNKKKIKKMKNNGKSKIMIDQQGESNPQTETELHQQTIAYKSRQQIKPLAREQHTQTHTIGYRPNDLDSLDPSPVQGQAYTSKSTYTSSKSTYSNDNTYKPTIIENSSRTNFTSQTNPLRKSGVLDLKYRNPSNVIQEVSEQYRGSNKQSIMNLQPDSLSRSKIPIINQQVSIDNGSFRKNSGHYIQAQVTPVKMISQGTDRTIDKRGNQSVSSTSNSKDITSGGGVYTYGASPAVRTYGRVGASQAFHSPSRAAGQGYQSPSRVVRKEVTSPQEIRGTFGKTQEGRISFGKPDQVKTTYIKTQQTKEYTVPYKRESGQGYTPPYGQSASSNYVSSTTSNYITPGISNYVSSNTTNSPSNGYYNVKTITNTQTNGSPYNSQHKIEISSGKIEQVKGNRQASPIVRQAISSREQVQIRQIKSNQIKPANHIQIRSIKSNQIKPANYEVREIKSNQIKPAHYEVKTSTNYQVKPITSYENRLSSNTKSHGINLEEYQRVQKQNGLVQYRKKVPIQATTTTVTSHQGTIKYGQTRVLNEPDSPKVQKYQPTYKRQSYSSAYSPSRDSASYSAEYVQKNMDSSSYRPTYGGYSRGEELNNLGEMIESSHKKKTGQAEEGYGGVYKTETKGITYRSTDQGNSGARSGTRVYGVNPRIQTARVQYITSTAPRVQATPPSSLTSNSQLVSELSLMRRNNKKFGVQLRQRKNRDMSVQQSKFVSGLYGINDLNKKMALNRVIKGQEFIEAERDKYRHIDPKINKFQWLIHEDMVYMSAIIKNSIANPTDSILGFNGVDDLLKLCKNTQQGSVDLGFIFAKKEIIQRINVQLLAEDYYFISVQPAAQGILQLKEDLRRIRINHLKHISLVQKIILDSKLFKFIVYEKSTQAIVSVSEKFDNTDFIIQKAQTGLSCDLLDCYYDKYPRLTRLYILTEDSQLNNTFRVLKQYSAVNSQFQAATCKIICFTDHQASKRRYDEFEVTCVSKKTQFKNYKQFLDVIYPILNIQDSIPCDYIFYHQLHGKQLPTTLQQRFPGRFQIEHYNRLIDVSLMMKKIKQKGGDKCRCFLVLHQTIAGQRIRVQDYDRVFMLGKAKLIQKNVVRATRMEELVELLNKNNQ